MCDAGNHAVRVVDLDKRSVTTLWGTGGQVRMPNIPGKGTDLRLNSPWDVTIVGNNLYVAVAGPHQIWRLGICGARSVVSDPTCQM